MADSAASSGIVENDGALGQRAGLVGAQNIHAAEVLDRVQAADDDAAPAHGPGAGGQGHADDRRQQLRRQADRERNGKQRGTRSPGDREADSPSGRTGR